MGYQGYEKKRTLSFTLMKRARPFTSCATPDNNAESLHTTHDDVQTIPSRVGKVQEKCLSTFPRKKTTTEVDFGIVVGGTSSACSSEVQYQRTQWTVDLTKSSSTSESIESSAAMDALLMEVGRSDHLAQDTRDEFTIDDDVTLYLNLDADHDANAKGGVEKKKEEEEVAKGGVEKNQEELEEEEENDFLSTSTNTKHTLTTEEMTWACEKF
jgi:hypothetical protein